MKSRFSKIVVFALSLVLVFGAVFALSVGAEDAKTPEIIGKNIVYTDKTAIQIAVDPATVDTGDVKLVVTKADGAEITVSSYTVASGAINGVSGALVFTLDGIPASAICENVTIVVKSGDTESASFTYSVAEYFYERLYSDGIINATEGKALSQKALYERYIAYGAAAQDLFLNYDKDGNRVAEPVTLVDKYNVVAINKGVLANGKEVMISADSFSTTVTANADLAADKTFDKKWTVTTYGDTVTTQTVANGATVTANGIIAVTPVYTDAKGDFYNSDLKGTRYDYDSTATVPGFQTGSGNATLANVDGSLEYKATTKNGSTFRWTPSLSTSGLETPILVFETDIMFKDITSSTFGWLVLANGGKQAPQITFDYQKDGRVFVHLNSTDGVYIPANTWANLRVECDFTNGKMTFCVNNEYIATYNATYSSSGSTMARFSLVSSANIGDTILMDNIFYAFVEDGTPAN